MLNLDINSPVKLNKKIYTSRKPLSESHVLLSISSYRQR